MAAMRPECAVEASGRSRTLILSLIRDLLCLFFFLHNRCEQKFDSFIACLLNESRFWGQLAVVQASWPRLYWFIVVDIWCMNAQLWAETTGFVRTCSGFGHKKKNLASSSLTDSIVNMIRIPDLGNVNEWWCLRVFGPETGLFATVIP